MSKRVLITGCDSGIGLASAVYLAEQGHVVYASVLEAASAETIHNSAPNLPIRTPQLDITDPDSIQHVVEQMVTDVGGIDVLVNNAGVGLRGYFEDLQPDEIEHLFAVNVYGTMNVTRAVLPHMRQARSGHIIMITSVAGHAGSLGVSAYCASKHAQEGFGESLAMEVLPFGIKVSMIAPVMMQTERWTVNRGYGREAHNPDSPYHRMFTVSEGYADALVASSPSTPLDVARAIERVMAANRPKIHTIVGRRGRLLFWLRRHFPRIEELLIRSPAMRVGREAGVLDG